MELHALSPSTLSRKLHSQRRSPTAEKSPATEIAELFPSDPSSSMQATFAGEAQCMYLYIWIPTDLLCVWRDRDPVGSLR